MSDTPMSDTPNNTQGGMPSEIELLLPWYAAGALGEREARAVEAALANNPDLASRLEWARDEFAAETALNDAAGAPPDGDMAALFAKIDALPAPRRQAAAASGLGSRIGEFLAALSPRALAWSAMAAALAIVLQAGLLAGLMIRENSSTGYQTASVPNEAAADGSYVLIRFQPQVSAADIAAFLQTNKLSIVGGPTTSGLYRVRVAATKLAPDEFARLVKSLQSDKVINFLAPTV
jgi:anti-sigma-K factor RskA